MSVDVASLPAWKLALLERKRRQEVDGSDGGPSKADGSELLGGKIPPWKQEILFRKQQKRHSTGRTYDGLDGENRRSLSEILLSPDDGERCSRGVEPWPGLLSPVRDEAYYADVKTTNYRLSNTTVDHASESEVDDVPVEEERLPPVHQNPILLFDLEKRQQWGFQVGLSSPGASDSHQRNSLPSKLSKLHVNSHESLDGDSSEHIQCATNEAQDNDVFREEEVTYGKGFVSRLLQRFSYLSGKEDQPIAPPPPFFRSLSRGQSSEDFTKNRYDPDVRSKRNPARMKANSLDDLLTESMSSRSVVENGSAMNGRGDREEATEASSDHGGRAEVGIVLSAKSIFESLATSPTSIKNPPFQERRYTSAKRNHETTQEGQRSVEIHKEPNLKEMKDNTGVPSGPTVRLSSSSSTAHHPPAIIGPKPVYTGHLTSLQSAEKQPKKCPDAQKSGDVKLTEDTAEKTMNSAQTSITTDPRVTVDQAHKTLADPKITGSVSESPSLFDSNKTTNPPCDSKDQKSHLNISAHFQEPSKIKEHIPAHSISVPAQSHVDGSVAGNTKTHEPPPHKENTTVPKKPAQEPSKIKEHVPAHSISVPAQSHVERSVAGNAKTHEPPPHKENATVPKKTAQEPSKIKDQVPAHSISVPAQSHVERSVAGNSKTHEPLPHKENATTPKKPAPLRPGLLLIRPASNLTSTKTEYLQMTKYNDITRGEFAPAKRPIHKAGGSDDDDSDADEMDGTGDRSKYLKVRFEFEGGGVRIGRSLLAKTKQGVQLKINFDDSVTSTYEYPSEQSLIDSMPPEPGDADYPIGEQNGKALPSVAVLNHSKVDSGPPASNAAASVSSTVALSSYKSKTQVDFAFDSSARKNGQETLAPSSDLQPNQEAVATQSDNAVSWSDSTSSDHVLF